MTGVIWYSAPIMPMARTPRVPACASARVCGAQGVLRAATPVAIRTQPAARMPTGMVRKKAEGMDNGGAWSRLKPPVGMTELMHFSL